MRTKLLSGIAAVTAALPLAMMGAPAKASPVDVDLEIALLMDVSGSVSTSEFNLQRDGYKAAFQDSAIHSAISSLADGIAVTMVMWSSSSQQSQVVGWTHVTNATESNALASTIGGLGRPFNGLTAPGSAINFSVPLFGTETGAAENGFTSDRQIIDVSGDGSKNDGADTSDARDAALAAGVDVINGIVIGGSSSVLTFYQNHVIGGTNEDGSPAFALTADSFDDFEDGITRKLQAEITGTFPVPAPAALLVFGAGLLGLGLVRRRRA